MNSETLSQEEINLLLQGNDDINSEDDRYDSVEMDEIINEVEKDALGEIGNISMGTAATTLSTLLDRRVSITTPEVTITTAGELCYEYPIPFVAVDVKYKEGLEGSNILMINVDDVKIITDIMMGKEEIDTDRELTDIDLSAISEVMNQMMGSASTSLSEIFSKKIDIEPPESHEITFDEGVETLEVLKSTDPIIKVSFRMVIDDLIDSELMQLIPLDFGQDVVEALIGGSVDSNTEPGEVITEAIDKSIEKKLDMNKEEPMKSNYSEKVRDDNSGGRVQSREVEKEHVVVKKPEFESFDMDTDFSYNESIDLVGDIPVELTAELGRTTKKISEILEYGPGTVIELDKLVGEPLNIYANGKYIAEGEVVVIDDNFGIRVTDIDKSYNR